MKTLIVLSVVIATCLAQRPSFADHNGFGFPVIETTTPPTTPSKVGDRFGDTVDTTTTMRLPVQVNGDKDYFNMLNKLPIEHQPFWFINWKQEEEAMHHPHNNYPQRGDGFADNPNIIEW